MAASDARPLPLKNTAYRVTFPILNDTGAPVSGAAGLDSEVSKDGGTFTDCTNEATEIATSSGIYYLDLTSTEMNADTVAIIVKTSTSGAKTTPIILYPGSTTVATIGVNVVQAGGVAWGSGAITSGSIATGAIDADALATDAVTEIQSGLATAAALQTVDDLVDDLEGRLTAARAGYLDNLSGGAVSTAAALATLQGLVDDLEGRLTAARAGYLDNLSGGAVATASALTTVVGYIDTEVAAILAAVDTEVAAIKAKTDNLPADPADDSDIDAQLAAITAYLDTEIAAILAAVDTEIAAIKAKTDNLPASPAAVGSAMTLDADAVNSTSLAASAVTEIQSGLSTLTAGQVNAEIVDALTTDTYAEPGSVPAATSSLKDKIGFIFAALRNKRLTTATTDTIRNDADSAAIGAATLDDNGTTFSRGEYA